MQIQVFKMDRTIYSVHDIKLKRLRRPNFSTVELETLVDILDNYPELTAGKMQNHQSQQICSQRDLWEEVATLLNNSECNEVDRVERTGKEVREKWIDFKCRLKKRYRHISIASTSNNSSAAANLTNLDRKALKLLNNVQKKVRGISSSAMLSKMAGEAQVGLATSISTKSTTGHLEGHKSPRRIAPKITDSREWLKSVMLESKNTVDSPPSTSGNRQQSSVHIIPIYSNGPSNSSHPPEPDIRPNIDLIQVNTQFHQDTEYQQVDEGDSIYNSYDGQHTMDGHHMANDFSEDSYASGRTTTETLLGAMSQKQDRVIDLMMELVSETGQRRAVEEEAVGLLRNLVALQARRVELEEIKLGIRHGSPRDDLDA